MTAVLQPISKRSDQLSTLIEEVDSIVDSSNLPAKLSPTSSETENEPACSIRGIHKNSRMSNSEDLILNTNFDFHAPAFSSQHLQDDSKRQVVTDHVLENGERVVVVDPNVSDNEEDKRSNQEAVKSAQLSPLDKAISSLFAAASNNQLSTHSRKRSVSPTPKTVSGILAAKRRKVERPQKRPSNADLTPKDSLLASSSFLSSLAATPSTSAHQKPEGNRPSSSSSDLGTSKSSFSDSDVVSVDEQPTVTSKSRGQKKLINNNGLIPAPVLQLLINAAGGDVNNTNLSELLAADSNLLKTINEVITANPSQKHTLQIVSTKPKEEPSIFGAQQSTNTVAAAPPQPNYPTADQISAALALWPELISTASKLDEQTTAKILSAVNCKNSQPVSNSINNNEESRVQSDDEEYNQQELLRLGSEWLLRELFKRKTVDKPQPTTQGQSLRKRKLEFQSPQLKSSESVLSQLKSLKGQKQLAELEELEQFASYFKRQRIKHGFTQGDVGVALGRRYGTDFSQTTISRFEALNLSFKNMCKLRPLMEEWINEAEVAIQRGFTVSDIVEAETLKTDRNQTSSVESVDNSPPASYGQKSPFGLAAKSINPEMALMPGFTSSSVSALNSVLPTLKKRRKRTNLDNQQKDKLDTYFSINSRPDHQQMQDIANELDLDPDVVRVWYCNRRQKLRKV